MTKRTVEKGFTLIELLIVIAIIGLLAAVVLIAINPAEMMKRGRDSQRLSDLTNLKKAIDVYIATNYSFPVAVDGAQACAAATCVAADRSSEGVTGWFGGVAGGGGLDLSDNIPSLPVDPRTGETMTDAAGNVVVANYTGSVNQAANVYELNCYLESTTNVDKLTNDGGDNADVFETGTDAGLDLIT